jgi:hypothetical protein
MTKPTNLMQWRRSSQCGNATCVEVAEVDGHVLVRDSKNPEVTPFSFTREEWTAFVAGVKQGEFD